jgi:hypothetical protein
MHYLIPDFRLQAIGPISNAFIEKEVYTFKEALDFVKQLPYKRNKNKTDEEIVLKDLCGTCSTKHAVIKRLADEQGLKNTELMLGIFMLGQNYNQSVAKVLYEYQLNAIPEAHNYLKINGQTVDLTFEGKNCNHILGEPIDEIAIHPEQITDFKIQYHKEFIADWLKSNQTTPYSADQMWNIREQCIAALSL